MKIISLLLVFLLVQPSHSALPPDAQEYLNKIPEKRLTLPFVIKAALQQALAYKNIGYDFATAELEEMGQVDSLTDTVFTAGANYNDDNSVKSSPFQAVRQQETDWSLGVSKNWGTGTITSIDWTQQTINSQLSPAVAGFGILNEFKQTIATIQLQQSLLKDSFGYAFRRKRQAARARAEGIQWQARNDLETVTIGFISEYYTAWLQQQQVNSLSAQVERQKRLVRILTGRSRKGAVERPDLIQIEALLAATKTSLSKAKYDLSNQWDKLAIGLNFPETFLSVNPMDIPTAIDNPVPLGIRVCGQKEPIKTAKIRNLEKRLEGLDNDFKAAKNESLPDVRLVAGYRGNSIDDTASQNLQNVLNGRQENAIGIGPAWNVGVTVSWPLANSAAKAQRTQKYIEKGKTAVGLQSAVDELKSSWRDACRKLQVEAQNERIFDNVVKEQKKRVKDEERRFRLGRIRVDQLVNAENDLGDWEFQAQQKKVQVRQLAWQVQQYSGEMYRFLSPHIRELLERGAQ